MERDTERILNGEEPLPPSSSKNYEGDLPKNFTDWLTKNEQRIADAKSLPYFLADNQGLIDGTNATANTGGGGGNVGGGNTVATGGGGGGGGEPPVNNNGGGGDGGGFGDEPPKTLQHLDESIANYKHTDQELKAREPEIVDLLKKLFDNSDFGLQLKASDLALILVDGEFKNQFQTGTTSGGALESTKTSGQIEPWNRRLAISHLMFGGKGESSEFGRTPIGEYGYMGKQWERSDYEKYGCLLDKDMAASYRKSNLAKYYGDIQIRFKKDMLRDRCTWTGNDSLDFWELEYKSKWFQPTLVSDPHIESFDKMRKESVNDFINKSKWENVTEWQQQNHTYYIELQFHGKLTTEYIKNVLFPTDPRKVDEYMKLAEKCKAMGIEVWYLDGDKAVKY